MAMPNTQNNNRQLVFSQGLVLAAGLAVGFSLIFFLRSLVFGNERPLVDIMLWQLAVWAPWLVFVPAIKRLVVKFPGRSGKQRRETAVHAGFALLLIAAHVPWFVWLSNEMSPYRDLEGTRFGVFQYLFIFWAVIDLFLYWATMAVARSGRQDTHIAELELRLASAQESETEDRPSSGAGVLRLEQLAVRKGTANIFLSAEEIDWIEAEDYYARLHVGETSHLVRMSLTKLEKRLDPAKFIRIHRSTIINLDRLEGMERLEGGDHQVLLKSGVKRRVSRNGLATLRRRVSMIS